MLTDKKMLQSLRQNHDLSLCAHISNVAPALFVLLSYSMTKSQHT